VTARRLTPLFLVLSIATALLAGCGSGNDGGSKGGLAEPLSYMPQNAPLVAAFDTDPNGEQFQNIDRLLGKFPFGGQVKTQIKQSLAQSGTNYDEDIKPLLGNQLVVGSPDARSLTDDNSNNPYILAFESGNGDKLRAALNKDGSQKKAGKIDGADVWQSQDGSVAAVKGSTLVGANDRPNLEAALKRHDGGDNLSEDDFNAPFQGLPASPIARVYGDAQALIESDPKTATARQVKWVGGLRKFGATVNVEGDGLSIDARVNTEGVSNQDLPIAGGDQSPALARYGDYSFGQRNPAQSVHFGEATAAKTDPKAFADYQKRKQAFGKKLKIDVDSDLIDQLNGDATVAGGLDGSWALRSSVKDPAAMKATLDKMKNAGRVGKTTLSESGGLIKSAGDGKPAYFGMVGDVFVAGPTPDAAKQMTAVEPKPVPGAKGASVVVADGEAIAKAILQRSGQGGGAAGLFTGPIGDLVAYVSAAPGGLRAQAKLKIE
jgi:hypothetical protein